VTEVINRSSILLLGLGVLFGIGGVGAYKFSMSYTSTDEFCLSCHNHDIPYEELRQTAHFANTSGIAPGCADCHLPVEFGPKMVRKLQASREVWNHFIGTIDTDEKYLAHREEMKDREIARLRANDSQECRNCHQENHWNTSQHSRRAQQAHDKPDSHKTCIDCHKGVAHMPAG
jgi:cytochrome c-type protein NapC